VISATSRTILFNTSPRSRELATVWVISFKSSSSSRWRPGVFPAVFLELVGVIGVR